MRVHERVSERAHAEGHLRCEVAWKVQCLSFCGLSISIVGETTHIPRPLYKPTLRNRDLQASHGTAGCGGRFLSDNGRGFARTPVFGVKLTPAARETVVIHYGSDVCCLEAAEKRPRAIRQEIREMTVVGHSRRTKARGPYKIFPSISWELPQVRRQIRDIIRVHYKFLR